MSRHVARIATRLAVGLALAAALPPHFSARAADPQGEPPLAAPPAPPVERKQPANRLARETSPYLLLHAHNPVDWYAWGEEALERAKREQKLIFLSVGYSSCYWCHVMERESFMDAEVAAYLNQHFVCIKVDREERPDIDQIYLAALAVQGRRGGWPLTMLLTPEARPIVGGTYFPPRDKDVEVPGADAAAPAATQRVTGLLTLAALVQDAWAKDPLPVRAHADQVAAAVRRSLRQSALAAGAPEGDLLARALAGLADEFDPQFGGFGYSDANPRRPKFPEPSNLLLLLAVLDRGDDPQAQGMLLRSLEHMAQGGIRDHLGGGFHRYSTDRYWRIPHFEKMLYDNAQLASVYARAYARTGREDLRRVVDELLAFVARELTDPAGGFYSALDAETAGVEGQYYAWQRDEVAELLEPDEYRLFASAYGLAGEPNFERSYVPVLSAPVERLAADAKLPLADYLGRLAPIRAKLLAARTRRTPPLVDTKILTSWNGLMIRGLADAGRLLARDDYLRSAEKAADFVLAKLRSPDGRLLRTYGAGQAKLNAYLDDYALLVDGLLALHEATGERRWLTAADELTRRQIELFWDDEQGGFFFTSGDHEELIARGKDPVDSATPSGNAVAAANLVALAAALERPEYLDRAEKTVRSFASILNAAPASAPRMAIAWTAIQQARAKP